MRDNLRRAIDEVRVAIEDEGRAPKYHRDIMRRHRAQWPTLWNALDDLFAARLLDIRREADQ